MSAPRTMPEVPGAEGAGAWRAAIGYVLLGLVAFAVVQKGWGFLGDKAFVTTLAGLLAVVVYGFLSFRNLRVPFIVLILAIGGFKFLIAVRVPFLPDLYLDRIMLVWLTVVFLVKTMVTGRRLRGPYGLDVLIVVFALYTISQVYVHDMQFFNVWVNSILIPFTVYFLAKNIIRTTSAVRTLFAFLLALSIYYNVTSVAEKFNITWLIWPKYIITMATEQFQGRSQGPFMQAPLFGTVIGMLLPLHLYFIATVRNRLGRLALGLSLVLGLAGLYFTYTRGSWLTGVVALLVTVALNRKAYLRYLAPVALVVPLLAVSVLNVSQDKFLQERVSNDQTIGSRIGTAVTVLRVWRDHPLFGVGFFQYRNVRDNYIQPVEVPGMPVIRFFQFRHNAIHDIYLGPLAETGLVGIGLQFSIYLLAVMAFFRKYRERSRGDPIMLYALPVFGGIMTGYFVGGIAFDYRFFAIVPTLLMMCAGVMNGDLEDSSRQRAPVMEPTI